jgi:hypothetical protein
MVWIVSEVLSLEGPWVRAVSCERGLRGSADEVDLRKLRPEAELRLWRGFCEALALPIVVSIFSAWLSSGALWSPGAVTGSEGTSAGRGTVSMGSEGASTCS